MHTAVQLRAGMFDVIVDGQHAAREDIFPDWNDHDRLGVVVTSPFGAVGAANLIQLAITAFFDHRPQRRSKENPIYPEFFIFHVGGYWGNYRYFDFFPPRKEVEVTGSAPDVLADINDRGITRLIVPDHPRVAVEHYFKEPASALDRITTAIVYSATGRTSQSDVEIRATGSSSQANVTMTLSPERWRTGQLPNQISIPDKDDERRSELLNGLVDYLPAVRASREVLTNDDGEIVETYRRVSVADALDMLAPRVVT
ncbi:MAG: hypothetical protein QM673_00090 [Gordonia sp. (in: high G+C Gram-positive bacteria)]